MLQVLEVGTLFLVALAMAFSVAHAAEWPGKLRLDEAAYRATQRIYYPGFTIGGLSEPLAIVALAILFYATPRDSAAVWLVGLAFIGVVAAQIVYWILIHPVNGVWLQDEKLALAGENFFSLASGAAGAGAEWTVLRDRWERAHALRAALTALAFILLATAATRPSSS